MNPPPAAADVRRLKPLGREGRSEPPDVGCYQWGWFMAPMRARLRRRTTAWQAFGAGSSSHSHRAFTLMITLLKSIGAKVHSGLCAKQSQTWLLMLFGAALSLVACPEPVEGAAPGRAAISTLDFTGFGGVEEGNPVGMVLTVYRSGSLAETVSVEYATVDGTAIGEFDFVPVSGTLTFKPGESSKTITVFGLNDTLAEGFETFTVVLSNPSPCSASIRLPTAA